MRSEKQLPEGWRNVAIKDISAQLLNGGTPSTEVEGYWEGTIPWVTGADFEDQKLLLGRRHITQEAVKNSATNVVPKGQLLVLTRTGVGKVAEAPTDVAISQDITGLIVEEQRYDRRFIYWQLDRLIPQLGRFKQGTSINGILREDLEKFELPVPKRREEQTRIAQIIDSLNDAIEAARAVIEQTRQVKRALLDELILRGLPGRQTRLVRCHLSELFEERKQKGKPGLPTLSVTMADGLVDRESLDRRVETDLTPEQHLLVCKGDIAYNMMRMWQGVFGLAWHDGIVSPAYVVLKPKPAIDSHYASYLFRHRSTIRRFERFSQGLTGDRLRLYFDQFCQIPVEIPDRKSQQKIAEILQAVDDRLTLEEEKLIVMSSLKAALSQGLLTGRIPVGTTDKEVA